MKTLLTLTTAILITCTLSAQKSNHSNSFIPGEESTKKAVIKGNIIDKATGETIIGANVFIPSSTTGTTSDFYGNFSLECPSGYITLKVSFLSYDTQEYTLWVKPGEEKNLNIVMQEMATKLAQVEVKAKANRENENLLLMEQKKAGKIQESIGAQELSEKGISDVAGGVKKISGISMIGKRNVFVRGLGDRYNKTELNGSGIASPNPEKRLLPLDMFPVNIISSIDVQKIYAASDYADYSGALINIQTKDYPEKGFLKIKAGTKINTQTTFNAFKMAETPSELYFGHNTSEKVNHTPEALNNINNINTDYYFGSDPFSTDFDFQQTNAKPDLSIGISGGKSWHLSNNHTIGAVFSSSYSNGYAFFQGNDMVMKADGTTLQSFVFDQYTYSTSFSNLAAVTWEHKNHKIGYNLIYLNNSDNQLTDKTGFDGEGYDLFVRNMMNHQHSLLSNQLQGDHDFGKRLNLSWDASYSRGISTEPDRRNVVYERSESTYGDDNIPYQYYTLFTLNQGETYRYFSDMADSTLSGGVHIIYELGKIENAHTCNNIQVGIQGMSKNRDLNSYMYFYNVDGMSGETAGVANPENGIFTPNPYDIDVTNNINDAAFADSSVFINNNTQNRDSYGASLHIVASYAEWNYNITPVLFLNIGLRGAFSDQTIAYFDTRHRENSIYGLDIFPAMNLKYTLSEHSNLRFAVSKTMTRASFLEMAPFRYRPSYGSATTFGNENIQNADNYNADVKYEVFPAIGELISLAAYGKILKSPIERISLNQGGGMEYTYRNAKGGKVFGLEMEIKKKLMDKLAAGINASYIHTQIELDQNSSNTFKNHAMQGASPYLVNADVRYNILDLQGFKTDVSLMYNVYGKRIYAVGDGGKGDIHEMPFNSVDAMIKTSINERWEFNLSARNLLNAERVFVQDIVDTDDGNYIRAGEREVNRYKTGMWFTMGISYKIKQ